MSTKVKLYNNPALDIFTPPAVRRGTCFTVHISWLRNVNFFTELLHCVRTISENFFSVQSRSQDKAKVVEEKAIVVDVIAIVVAAQSQFSSRTSQFVSA